MRNPSLATSCNTPETFVAIDFETATRSPQSACAVALVRVEDWSIVRCESRLIRPPSSRFEFTYIHGVTWNDVEDQPDFAGVWRELSPMLEGVSYLAAHNASFDRGVLNACCVAAGLPAPSIPFVCSMVLARKHWRIFPTRLPDVCRALSIPLQHHNAASDAEACARIVVSARQLVKSVPHTTTSYPNYPHSASINGLAKDPNRFFPKQSPPVSSTMDDTPNSRVASMGDDRHVTCSAGACGGLAGVRRADGESPINS